MERVIIFASVSFKNKGEAPEAGWAEGEKEEKKISVRCCELEIKCDLCTPNQAEGQITQG